MSNQTRHIAIIGAGIGGLAAAFDLRRAGYQVSVFEASETTGGLAAGFKEPHWDWSVERFYHHWFTSDAAILGLVDELGLRDRLVIPSPKTVVYHQGGFYRLDSPLAALTFPGFSFVNMVRFGLVTVYLRYLAGWRPLENQLAAAWMRKWYGESVYQSLYEPMLQGKFGSHFQEVNMAWMWARLKTRTTRLMTFQGGFQSFSDLLSAKVQAEGGSVRLSTPVQRIDPLPQGGVRLSLPEGPRDFDACLSTTSPAQMARLAPALPADYLRGLLDLRSMGAVVLILSLREQLSREGYYWYNLPKSAGYPFLALVEHTNFLKPEYFGGDHILYCGDYLDTGHEHFQLSKEELLERFIPGIARFNPNFKREWIKNSWLFKTAYAQPIPLLGHSRNIPAVETPLSGLFFASMSQVYPWDRGTNFAVEINRRAAAQIQAYFRGSPSN